MYNFLRAKQLVGQQCQICRLSKTSRRENLETRVAWETLVNVVLRQWYVRTKDQHSLLTYFQPEAFWHMIGKGNKKLTYFFNRVTKLSGRTRPATVRVDDGLDNREASTPKRKGSRHDWKKITTKLEKLTMKSWVDRNVRLRSSCCEL